MGGVFYVYGDAYVNDEDSILSNNTADFGGAFYLKIANGVKALDLLGSTFSSNKAYYNGGAINIESDTSNVGIAFCEFISNVAYYGMTYSTSDVVQYGGGAIYIGYGNEGVTIHNSIFINNIAAGGMGGAIWSYSTNSDLAVTSSNFSHNSAKQGGAITIFAYHEDASVSESLSL